MLDDGRILAGLGLFGLTVGLTAVRGSLGILRRGRADILPARCGFCGAIEDDPCQCFERELVEPVILTGALAGHPLPIQRITNTTRDAAGLLRSRLLVESDQLGNVVVEDALVADRLIFSTWQDPSYVRKGDRVQIPVWPKWVTKHDRDHPIWSAYGGRPMKRW